MWKNARLVGLVLLIWGAAKPDGSVVVGLRIGAIVNTGELQGREQRVAVEIAARHFNTSPALFLSIKEWNDATDPLRAASFAQELITWRTDILIAIGSWPDVATVAAAARIAKLPVISTTMPLPWMLQVNPFLIPVSYPIETELSCLAALIGSYNFRRVITIMEDDSYGSSASTTHILFANALRLVGASIADSVIFPPVTSLTYPSASIHVELARITAAHGTSTVYVVLRSSASLATMLFQVAAALGMTNTGNAWFVGDDISILLDDDTLLSPAFVSTYMQGVVGIKSYVNQTASGYRAFADDFSRSYNSAFGKSGFEPTSCAARAYDAVNFCVKYNGSLERLVDGELTGLSGLVRPSNPWGPPYRIINIVGRSYKDLGFWIDGFGFSETEEGMGLGGSGLDALRVVYWPGGPKKPPGGWRRMLIGVPAHPVFSGFIDVEYPETNSSVVVVKGFCIDVFHEMVKRLPYQLSYDFIPFSGSYDALVEQVHLQKFDLVVGDVTILTKRLANVSFTEPFLTSGLSMLVPMKRDHNQWVLTKPFSKEVWLLIFTLLAYNGFLVWFFERQEINSQGDKMDQQHTDFQCAWYKQLGATLWIILTTIFNQYGDGVRSYYTKTVIVFWLFAVLILSSSFTANLSSILVTQKLKAVVDDSKIGCDSNSFVVDYLQTALNYKPENIVQIKAANEYPTAFQNKTITAAFLEAPYTRVFLSQYDGYTVTGETHILGGFGFALPRGSPLTADMSKAILELQEDGKLRQLENKWFSTSLSNLPFQDKSPADKEYLGIGTFWPAFLLTGGMSTIALLVFCLHHFHGDVCKCFRNLKRCLRDRLPRKQPLDRSCTGRPDPEANTNGAEQSDRNGE